MAYPVGMHRMHVHPPSPPCASPPPAMCIPPPPQPQAGYEKRGGSGQQEKNEILFTCDLIIFCRVSLPSKLLTSTETHNLGTRQGIPKNLKICRCFMVQERHLSQKLLSLKHYWKFTKNLDGCYCLFYSLSLRWF